MTKTIDTHGAALDALLDQRNALEYALQTIKPQIRKLNQLRQKGDVLGLAAATFLFGGNMSELTKDSNELRRRLNSVEETRKLLKRDRALQHETVWEDEQHRLEMEKIKSNLVLPCGCW
jgi:prefoldin subunit 5